MSQCLPAAVWGEDARQRLQDTLAAAWGELPADLTVIPVVERGEPGPVLTAIASQPGDVLVIGTGRRGTLARVFAGRVSRYCLAHGRAPIVAIPPPALTPHLRHSPLNWVFWHRPLTPSRVLHDRGKTAALPGGSGEDYTSRPTSGGYLMARCYPSGTGPRGEGDHAGT